MIQTRQNIMLSFPYLMIIKAITILAIFCSINLENPISHASYYNNKASQLIEKVI